MRPSLQRATGLATVLRGVVADMQQASGADIASVFLHEEASRRFFAPFAVGQPQESLLDSLADMSEQLARYTSDAAQGKVPADLGVHKAIRANQTVRELEALATDLLARSEWTGYAAGTRPVFVTAQHPAGTAS